MSVVVKQESRRCRKQQNNQDSYRLSFSHRSRPSLSGTILYLWEHISQGLMGLLKNPVIGRCLHLPENTAHLNMCCAQELVPATNYRETSGFITTSFFRQAIMQGYVFPASSMMSVRVRSQHYFYAEFLLQSNFEIIVVYGTVGGLHGQLHAGPKMKLFDWSVKIPGDFTQ